MLYQEKVSTRGDVHSLYERVKQDPTISRYRGYTATKSYGWDEDVGDFIKADGERWFENPCYDPDFFAPDNEERPMNEMKPEDVMKALEICEENKKDCYHCPQWVKCVKGEIPFFFHQLLPLLREKDAEIERLNIELQAMRGAANSLKMHLETERAEAIADVVAQLEAEVDSSDKYIAEYDGSKVQVAYNNGLRNALKIVKEMEACENGKTDL